MIENNDKNREALAEFIADNMDIESLVNFVMEVLVERYEKCDVSFNSDVEFWEFKGEEE